MKEIISKLSGSVLGIGLDDELLSCIEKNNKVTFCDVLNDNSEGLKSKNAKNLKRIRVKKVKRKYKKKIDYMIIEASEINSFRHFFVKDSIIITNKCIYLYGEGTYNSLDRRYRRIGNVTKITNMKYKNGFILKIETKGKRKLKIRISSFIDNLIDIGDYISDFLIS